MDIIFLGAWLVLTIIVYLLYCKMYPIRIHTDVIMDNMKEVAGSAIAALLLIVVCGILLIKYIQIVVPIIVIIIAIVFYKKKGNPKIIIAGVVLAIVAFGGLKYFNTPKKNIVNKDAKVVEQNKSTDANETITSESNIDKHNKDEVSKDNRGTEGNESIKSTKTAIDNNIKAYIHGFVDDVDEGKANICLNYLEEGSELYNTQLKNIPAIAKNFKEEVKSVEVKDIKQIDSNIYSVQVIENIAINKDNSGYKDKEYHNSYTVVKIDGNYLIRSMKSNSF